MGIRLWGKQVGFKRKVTFRVLVGSLVVGFGGLVACFAVGVSSVFQAVAIFAGVAALYAGPVYYGISLVKMAASTLASAFQLEAKSKPGDQYRGEKLDPLDFNELRKSKWPGRKWYEDDGPGVLHLNPTEIDEATGNVPVSVRHLPDGPLDLKLISQSKHCYGLNVFCNEHSGWVSDEPGLLIRLHDNGLRLIVEGDDPTQEPIDIIFRSQKH